MTKHSEHSTMTPEEFAEYMQELIKDKDIEMRHVEADITMCEILSKLGYGDGVDIFYKMRKDYT